MSLEDWAKIGDKLTEDELLDILTTTEYEPEAWRLIAALGFLALQREEIGLQQIEALTSAGLDIISLTMFDAAFAEPSAGDELADMLEG